MTPILAPTVSADAADYGDDYIGNLDADFPDLPGTAIDTDTITPAQYEAGRLLRATKINPTWNVDRPAKGRRGRPKGSGHPPRPTRTRADGTLELKCNKCLLYLPAECFYRRLNSRQPTCKLCNRSRGGEAWRKWHDAREAELCAKEQG